MRGGGGVKMCLDPHLAPKMDDRLFALIFFPVQKKGWYLFQSEQGFFCKHKRMNVVSL